MSSETPSSWTERLGIILIAAMLSFLFAQLWALQAALNTTANKLNELVVYSNETLTNTRQLIALGVSVADVTTTQLKSLEQRVSSIEHKGSLMAQSTNQQADELQQRVRKLEDFVTAHGSFNRQDYEDLKQRLKALEGKRK